MKIFENYSVLMSVYYKENPFFFKEAIQSILEQSVLTNDFVLVCDGPLTSELNSVISEYSAEYNFINVVRLDVNQGLGEALNFGLSKCKNELVMRMDTDDISLPMRAEKQLDFFCKNSDLTIVSGVIEEFISDKSSITGKRVVPSSHDSIIKFSKRRNPFNHPAVMFKKPSVLAVGGYNERFHLFEDYYLWIRLLQQDYKGSNTEDTLLLMRTPSDIYRRRGGVEYAIDLLRFNNWLLRTGWIGLGDYIKSALPHAIICILPNSIRKWIYNHLHS